MQPGWRFFSRYDINNDGHELWISLTDHQGKRWLMSPLSLTEMVPGSAPATPTIASYTAEGPWISSGPFLQAALEAAWEMGLRPKAYADHANELTAVRYHLEDMRALAKVPTR